MNKRIIRLTSLALCLCLALSSCSNKEKQKVEDSREQSQTVLTTNKDREKETDKLEKKEEAKDKKEEIDKSYNYKKAGLLYNKILDNIDSYEFSDLGEDADITYTYDLVYTRSSDIPDLLVAQNTKYGLSYLKIFSHNDDFTKEIYTVVRVLTHDEMIEYQDINPESLPDMGESYVVLIADEASDVSLSSGGGDGYFTKTCDIISLPSDMDIYQDQYITISFGPDDGYWQSGFSLPVDAPRMLEVNVIE